MIDDFRGYYRWLSNFQESPITYKGKDYPTVEHAYQAAKAVDPEQAEAIRVAETPSKAKKLGGQCVMREDWDDVRLQVMEECLRLKFQIPFLRQRLLDTCSEELVEGNLWNDTFWGVCKGKGANMLGKLLMKIREEIRNGS